MLLKNLRQRMSYRTMTLSALLEMYKENVLLVSNLAIGTRNGYLSAIRVINRVPIARMQVRNVTHDTLQSFFDGLSEGYYDCEGSYHEGYGKSRILAFSAVLHSSFSYAMRLGIVKVDPMVDIHLVSTRSEKSLFQKVNTSKVLTHKQFLKIIKYLHKTNNPCVLPIQISYYTGLRLGEVCALTWEDVHLEEQYLVVQRAMVLNCQKEKNRLEFTSPKRDKVRVVVFGNKLKKILLEERNKQLLKKSKLEDKCVHNYYTCMKEDGTNHYLIGSGVIEDTDVQKEVDLVCVKEDGRYISRRYLGWLCIRINKYIEGLEGFHFHVLRHTYASNLLKLGATMAEVKELLGHEDIRTTMDVYVHASREEMMQRVRSLDKLY